eukprot:gene6036-8310_t
MLSSSSNTIDFGEIYYADGLQSQIKQFRLFNDSTVSALKISLKQQTQNDFPISVQLYYQQESSSDMKPFPNFIYVRPNESLTVCAILLLHLNSMLQPKTSYFKVSSSITFSYHSIQVIRNDLIVKEDEINNSLVNEVELDEPLLLRINVSTLLCTSMLYIDEEDLIFNKIAPLETKSRELQIWNRSECMLEFSIHILDIKQIDKEDMTVISTELLSVRFSYNTEESALIESNEIIQLVSFATKPIYCFITPKDGLSGKFTVNCIAKNLNNPSNEVSFRVQVNVVNKNQMQSKLELSLIDAIHGKDYFSPEFLNDNLPQVPSIDLGSHYAEETLTHSFYIRNNTKVHMDLLVNAETINNQQVSLKFDDLISYYVNSYEDIKSLNHSSKSSAVSHEIVNNTLLIESQSKDIVTKDITDKNAPLSRISKIDTGKSAVAAGKTIRMNQYKEDIPDQLLHRWSENDIAVGTVKDSKSASSNTKIQKSNKVGGFSNGSTLSNYCSKIWSENAIPHYGLERTTFVKFSNDSRRIALDDYFQEDNNDYIYNFVSEPSSLSNSGTTNSLLVDMFSNNEKSMRITNSSLLSEFRPFLGKQSSTEPQKEKSTTGDGANKLNGDEEKLKRPKYCYVRLSPESQASFSIAISGGTEKISSVTLENFSSAIEFKWKLDLIQSFVLPLLSQPLSYLNQFFRMQENGIGSEESKQKSTRLMVMYSYCISCVTVTPMMVDFGQCSVGDYRSITFDVLNTSDLPALIYPSVESDTLGVREIELTIPPHQTKQIHVEYVARLENPRYSKNVMVKNHHNPDNSLSLLIKAKNVDTNQILLHSMFYKIITYNTKRQLQIYFEKCLTTMPNLKQFSIKNLHSKPLRIEFSVKSSSSIILYKINKHPANVVTNNTSDNNSNTKQVDFKVPSWSNISRSGISLGQKIEELKWGESNWRSTLHSFRRSQTLFDLDIAPNRAISRTRERVSEELSLDLQALNVFNSTDVQRKSHRMLSSSNELSKGVGTNEIFNSVLNKSSMVSTIDKEKVDYKHFLTAFDFIKKMDKDNYPLSYMENTILTLLSNEEVDNKVNGSRHEFNVSKSLNSSRSATPSRSETGKSNSTAGMTTLSISENKLYAESFNRRRSSSDSKDEVGQIVKEIQLFYNELFQMLSRESNDSIENALTRITVILKKSSDETDERMSGIVEIPVGETTDFALVLAPQISHLESQQLDDLVFNRIISEAIVISLPDVDSEIINNVLLEQKQSVSMSLENENGSNKSDLLFNLKPRNLSVRARTGLSELIVLQKNINFGRTLVGDITHRVITMLNKSNIPCLYSISKSGSISSGYLSIPEGRKGAILPMASKSITLIFRPFMAETFEENIVIKNIFNPNNLQAITIKAKVTKNDSFLISACSNNGNSFNAINRYKISQTSEVNLNNTEEQFAKPIDLYDVDEEFSYIDHALINQLKINSSVSSISEESKQSSVGSVGADLFLGVVAVGERCDASISFKVKNLTSKPRQMIVDSAHAEAIVLLIPTIANERPSPTDPVDMSNPENEAYFNNKFNGNTDANNNISQESFPFEPIPEVLQTVVTVRCSFKITVNTTTGSDLQRAQLNKSMLSEEEELALRDQLEFFQQKLKIAIRKNKEDKIAKYEKKIAEKLRQLSSDTNAVVAENTKIVEASNKPQQNDSTRVDDHSIEESSLTCHFTLEPDQEKVVTIKLSVLPGASYQSWVGMLPFKGYFRVFESKNEDFIKNVGFCAMLYSSRLSFLQSSLLSHRKIRRATSRSSSFDYTLNVGLGSPQSGNKSNSQINTTPKRTILLSSKCLSSNSKHKSIEDNPSEDYVAPDANIVDSLESNTVLVTVCEWSCFPTKQLLVPTNLHDNVVGVSVKLVQASKDQLMHGAFCLVSVLNESFTLTVSLDKSVLSNTCPSDFTLYDETLHGPITTAICSPGMLNKSKQESNQTNQKLEQSEDSFSVSNGFQFVVQSNKRLMLVLRWRPPSDIDKTVKIFGILNLQTMINGKKFGNTQALPFISFLDHKSIFKIDRQYNFEGDIPIGFSRSCDIPIFNISTTEELHYILTSEEISASSKDVGKIDKIVGQTGLVAPISSKQISLTFSATSVGKFEQKLWIRNLQDSFDQKRITIHASVGVSQLNFVSFPSLEFVDDELSQKYKPLNLGFIQLEASDNIKPTRYKYFHNVLSKSLSTEHLSLLISNNMYPLEIKNVSNQELFVTALSNLRSQCYIYCDEQLQIPAINYSIPPHSSVFLRIVIRPSISSSIESYNPSNPVSSPSGVISDTTPYDAKTEENTNKMIQNSNSKGHRNLSGGLRFLFFQKMDSDISIDSSIHSIHKEVLVDSSVKSEIGLIPPQNLRKLFEVAIPFTASIGKSYLKTSILKIPEEYINTTTYDKVIENTDICYVHGKLEIKNTSTTFPLIYSHVLDNKHDAICIGFDETEEKAITNLHANVSSFHNKDSKLVIVDESSFSLHPLQSKEVNFYILFKRNWVGGLFSHEFSLINLHTKDLNNTLVYSYFSNEQLKTTSVSTTVKSQPIMNMFIGMNENIIDKSEEKNLICVETTHPLWMLLNEKSFEVVNNEGIIQYPVNVDNTKRQFKPMATSLIEENKNYSSSNDCQSVFEVCNPNEQIIAEWILTNNHSNSMILTPVSDLPIIVSVTENATKIDQLAMSHYDNMQSHKTFKRGNKLSSAGVVSYKATQAPTTASSSPSMSQTHQISKRKDHIIAKWKRNLFRCGESFSLESNSSVKLTISIARGRAVPNEIIRDLKNKYGELFDNGSLMDTDGIVAFLKASHSLQQLFEPKIVNKTEQENLTKSTVIQFPDLELPTVTSNSNQQSLDTIPIPLNRPPRIGESVHSELNSSNILSVISATKLKCSFVAPQLKLLSQKWISYYLRCGQREEFNCIFENMSSVDIPCAFEKGPSWLQIMEYSCMSIPLNNNPNNQSLPFKIELNDQTMSYSFNAPKYSKIILKFIIISPILSQYSFLEHWITTKNSLNNSKISSISSINFTDHYTLPTEDNSLGIKIQLEIDPTRAIDLSIISIDIPKPAVRFASSDAMINGIESQTLLTTGLLPINNRKIDFDYISDVLGMQGLRLELVEDEWLQPLRFYTNRVEPLIFPPSISSIKSNEALLQPDEIMRPVFSLTSDERFDMLTPKSVTVSVKDSSKEDQMTFTIKNNCKLSMQVYVVCKMNDIMKGAIEPKAILKSSSNSTTSLGSLLTDSSTYLMNNSNIGFNQNLLSVELQPLETKTIIFSITSSSSSRVNESILSYESYSKQNNKIEENCREGQQSYDKQVNELISSSCSQDVLLCTLSFIPIIQSVNDTQVAQVGHENITNISVIPQMRDVILVDIVSFIKPSPTCNLLIPSNALWDRVCRNNRLIQDPPVISLDTSTANTTADLTAMSEKLKISTIDQNNPLGLIIESTITPSNSNTIITNHPYLSKEEKKSHRYRYSPDNLLIFTATSMTSAAAVAVTDISERDLITAIPHSISHNNSNNNLELIESELTFYVVNSSNNLPLHFSISTPTSIRHPGLKLAFRANGTTNPIDKLTDNVDVSQEQNNYNCYFSDTVALESFPVSHTVPPLSSVPVTLRLMAGNVSTAMKSIRISESDIPDRVMKDRWRDSGANSSDGSPRASSARATPSTNTSDGLRNIHKRISPNNDSLALVMCIPFEIIDLDYIGMHPPKKMCAYLTSDTMIPTLYTQPISVTDRSKQHLNVSLTSQMNEEDKIYDVEYEKYDSIKISEGLVEQVRPHDENDHNLSSFSLGKQAERMIRLRGVTPHPFITSRYIIDLGRQFQRKESIEWLITLENNNNNNTDTWFNISTSFMNDMDWITIGQPKGFIQPGLSSSIMLYFNKWTCGFHATYLFITAINCQFVVFVTMDVIPDARKQNGGLILDENNIILNNMSSNSNHIDNICDVLIHPLEWIDNYNNHSC